MNGITMRVLDLVIIWQNVGKWVPFKIRQHFFSKLLSTEFERCKFKTRYICCDKICINHHRIKICENFFVMEEFSNTSHRITEESQFISYNLNYNTQVTDYLIKLCDLKAGFQSDASVMKRQLKRTVCVFWGNLEKFAR